LKILKFFRNMGGGGGVNFSEPIQGLGAYPDIHEDSATQGLELNSKIIQI
jgi:hypothetical protein